MLFDGILHQEAACFFVEKSPLTLEINNSNIKID
jgi:hypothetical protein